MKPVAAFITLIVITSHQNIANPHSNNDENKLYKNCDKKCLYDRVETGTYEDAAEVTRHLVSNNLGAHVLEVVNLLFDNGVRNTISYAYKVWEMEHTIVVDYFPSVFKSLFTGNDVTIVSSNYNVSMMLGMYNDKEVVMTREQPPSYSARWILAPSWDSNHVYFRMTSAAPYLHLILESGDFGNRSFRVLATESYTETSYGLWSLEPLPGKRNTFYIINKRYGVALKTDTKDDLVTGHLGSPYNCKGHGWDILEYKLNVFCDVERETTTETARTTTSTLTTEDVTTPQADTCAKIDVTLFNAVMAANYGTALALTVKLDQSKYRSKLRCTVAELLLQRRNNVVSYGAWLWEAGHSSIATDILPEVIKRILAGDRVKIVHHNYNMALRVNYDILNKVQDRWVSASNIVSLTYCQEFKLSKTFIYEHMIKFPSVNFAIKHRLERDIYLKVDWKKSSSKEVWGHDRGISHPVLDSEFFYLEAFDYYGTILFYIVSKEYGRALTVAGGDNADRAEMAVVAVEGDYDDPLKFGWKLIP